LEIPSDLAERLRSNKEVNTYLQKHLTTKTSVFALKKSPFKNISPKELTEQLFGMQTCRKKIPVFFSNPNIIYPPKLNLEQCSSQWCADYKASLVSGEILIDVTGGIGVDSYFFSKRMKQVYHIELHENTQKLARHNFKTLQASNITSYCGDGIDFAQNTPEKDWIYIDPSRRDPKLKKVFFLEDCLPNVPDVLEHKQLGAFKHLLIKTSPLLDISQGLKSLLHVLEVHVVAVKNEVKELLWVVTPTKIDKHDIRFYAVNLIPKFNASLTSKKTDDSNHQVTTQKISFTRSEQHNSKSTFTTEVFEYLYEPSASLLKLGAFDWIGFHYKLSKLHPHAHLYTSCELLPDFMGKTFKVIWQKPFEKKVLKKITKQKASVVTRNFKMTPSELRKKYKLTESDRYFLFFTTQKEGKLVVIYCEKIPKP